MRRGDMQWQQTVEQGTQSMMQHSGHYVIQLQCQPKTLTDVLSWIDKPTMRN